MMTTDDKATPKEFGICYLKMLFLFAYFFDVVVEGVDCTLKLI